MAEKTTPDFVAIDSLRPGTQNLNLVVKVLDVKEVVNKKRPDGSAVKIAECNVGDASGTIMFTARNKQVDLMKVENTVTIRNGKIDMFKGTMRLAVDKWGLIQEAGAADWEVKVDNNLSLVEYELVAVTDR
mmetsp:Transcript_25632/g.40980  ORF Transcript_25632/g.40980 Transcript_25632/m.40980 type:complete len:131 (-) Transcript_25632:850-1242(-)